MKWLRRFRTFIKVLLLFIASTPLLLRADSPPPPGYWIPDWLDFWSFYDTNGWHSDLNYAPISFTNLNSSFLGNWQALGIDSSDPAWINCKINEDNGTTNLTLDVGSVQFWFAPTWASTNQGGAGPGVWSRLIEVGSYTTNASYGWWSLLIDPDGANIYFASQTNDGSGATYLSGPISWTTNYWHFISLTYSPSNATLYVDGEMLTNGPPVCYIPNASVRSNGFWIGSDSNGFNQAHGMFDDLSTYNFPLTSNAVVSAYVDNWFWYYGNPLNGANLSSGPSEPSTDGVYNAITGSGYLTSVSTNTLTCVSSSNVWMTNITASLQTNLTVNVTFTIAGGSDGVLYDVFANSVLDLSASTNRPWAWMGQGYHCSTYMLTNMPLTAAFLILGTPVDSDFDGLTDAYEHLVSKTNSLLWDTDGDGISDSDEVLNHTNPLVPNAVLTFPLNVQPCPQ